VNLAEYWEVRRKALGNKAIWVHLRTMQNKLTYRSRKKKRKKQKRKNEKEEVKRAD